MLRKIKYALVMAFWAVISPIYAQDKHKQQEVDSLVNLLHNTHDTVKVRLYRVLAERLAGKSLNKAIGFGETSLKLAQRYKLKNEEARTWDVLGSIYAHQGGYAQALEHKLKAIEIYHKTGNRKGIMQLSNNMGVLQFRNGNYQQALAHYETSLQMARETGNKEGESTYLLNIGEVYQKLNLWDKAIEYELAALKISEPLNLQEDMAYAYGILGQVYKAQGKFESAISNQQKALQIFRTLKDDAAQSEYLIRLAETYSAKGSFAEALRYAYQGLKTAESIKAIEWQKEAFGVLSDVYASKGDSVAAYRYHKRYATLKDQILNEMLVKQVAQLQSIYKISEQQARLDLMTKDKIIQDETLQLRTLMLYAFVGGFILIGALVGVLYLANVRKRRDNRLLEERRNEIQRIHDDITASIAYAKNIQDALLPTHEQIYAHLPDHFILFMPRDVVSGDFYWFQEKEERLFLAAIDCTGHGVPGAFMSMMGDAFLNQIVLDKELVHPDFILNELHRKIRKTLRQDINENKDGMDMALVTIDRQDHRLEFAGAHCPLVLIQNERLQYVKGDRYAIGGFQPEAERLFTRQVFNLHVPTTFYLFSDGYQDQFGGAEKRKYSIGRFRELLLRAHTLPIPEQHTLLHNEMEQWRSTCREIQLDDILVIGVRLG